MSKTQAPQPSAQSVAAAQENPRWSPPHLTLAELATIFDDPIAADAVFICIDCEAWEHDQHEVTEIGVAVFDTRDLPALDTTSLDV